MKWRVLGGLALLVLLMIGALMAVNTRTRIVPLFDQRPLPGAPIRIVTSPDPSTDIVATLDEDGVLDLGWQALPDNATAHVALPQEDGDWGHTYCFPVRTGGCYVYADNCDMALEFNINWNSNGSELGIHRQFQLGFATWNGDEETEYQRYPRPRQPQDFDFAAGTPSPFFGPDTDYLISESE